MQAHRTKQDLLQTECDAIHAKRRTTLTLMVQVTHAWQAGHRPLRPHTT
jgi:hypothetical protein